jgi:DNA-binding beta-propeller fold protein YncE
MNKYLTIIVILLLLSCDNKQIVSTLQVPGMNRYCNINIDGESTIPSGRIVKPCGEFILISHDPFGLALSPDGSLALAVHDNKLTLINTADKSCIEGHNPFQGKGSYMGAAITDNNKIAYLSGGDNGDILVFDLTLMESIKRISINGKCNDRNYKDSFVGDIRISDDEKRLYILDQFNFRMVIMDIENYRVMHSVPVGRFPLGIDISPNGKFAYIANMGNF